MAEKQPSPLQIKDLVPQNYVTEEYFSQDEIKLLQSVFGGNSQLIGLLRKLFIPTIHADLPIEDFANDIFGKGLDFKSIPNEEIKSIVLGRQEAIKFVLDGLVRLKVIVSFKDTKQFDPKDSTK